MKFEYKLTGCAVSKEKKSDDQNKGDALHPAGCKDFEQRCAIGSLKKTTERKKKFCSQRLLGGGRG